MRPVNLLPARYRPRAAGEDSKRPYIALGVLAALVLAVFGYVMTTRSVTANEAEIAQTQERITAAQAQAVTLEGFGDFAAIKQARLDAVKSLATARLDWERLFRELAHVLPAGVWLTDFDGAAGADSEDGGGEVAEGSALTLKGCADSHRKIADVMVRLRELHVAEEVALTETSKDEKENAATPALPGAPAAPGAEADEGCGSDYSFDIMVKVAPAVPGAREDAPAVPARLGGGA